MNGQYKKDADRYAVPEALKQRTVQLMQEEYSAQQEGTAPTPTTPAEPTQRQPSLRLWHKIAAVAALVLLFVIPMSRMRAINPILTQLSAESFVESVALRDGELLFHKESGASGTVSPPFSLWGEEKETTPAQYEALLQVTLPAENLDGYKLLRQVVEVRQSKDMAVVSDRVERTYLDIDGNEFRLVIATAMQGNPEFLMEDSNSRIGDTEVYLVWLESEHKYKAQYHQGAFYFYIEAEGVTQKDFILFLLESVGNGK